MADMSMIAVPIPDDRASAEIRQQRIDRLVALGEALDRGMTIVSYVLNITQNATTRNVVPYIVYTLYKPAPAKRTSK